MFFGLQCVSRQGITFLSQSIGAAKICPLCLVIHSGECVMGNTDICARLAERPYSHNALPRMRHPLLAIFWVHMRSVVCDGSRPSKLEVNSHETLNRVKKGGTFYTVSRRQIGFLVVESALQLDEWPVLGYPCHVLGRKLDVKMWMTCSLLDMKNTREL